MKKLLLGSVALVLIAACSSKGSMMAQLDTKIPTAQELQHHHYELVSVNGKELDLEKGSLVPTIAFGEGMRITGTMCNNFFGEGYFSSRGVLKAKGLGMTRKFCTDSALNNLDGDISELLDRGAEIIISENGQFLRLSNIQTALEFKLADKMR
ncbi:META domain-containing protein [Ignatzschineria rhizosphaerae]|uniref:META domain-containing protein n=1 Tax=Ignatzschineria rhizosphaerae TaxID=2923279 RepID=A0ABY3XB59_9GAMM|nr:META domain-containing protein [Ignatzschineria rhizosphaerae]UNM97188.1 META domain-containing protein [Ignatzschineria rhizosphaerae]